MAQSVTRNGVSHVLVSAVPQGSGLTGVGIVLKTRRDESLRKIAYALDNPAALQATFQAVLHALVEAARLGARNFTVYLDNRQAADVLNREVKAPEELQMLYVQIRCRANAMGRVRFRMASGAQAASARRLAGEATGSGPALNMQPGNRMLQLSFAEDQAA